MKNIIHKLKIIGIIVLVILCMILLIVSFGMISNYFKKSGHVLIGNLIAFSTIAIVTLGVIIFNNKFNKLTLNEYGFHFKGFLRNLLIGFSSAFLSISLVILFAYFIFDIQTSFTKINTNSSRLLTVSLVTTFALAAWEEIFFRGLVYTTLVNNTFSFHQSAIISSLFFSILHWSSFDMSVTSQFWYLGIFILGYIFVYLYNITKSIWSCVWLHFFWNFFVDMMDKELNTVGIFQINDYSVHSKTIDNIEVLILSISFLMILILRRNKSQCFY